MKKIVYNDIEEQNWLHIIRKNELDSALQLFPPKKNIKILEIGGGDGFIAKCISEIGYDITSIDIQPRYPQSFPVKQGNAAKINFPNEFFDVVFTCLVLPNIEDFETVFSEMKRVLKNDGKIIHIVPTSWWSITTNFWHFILLPIHILKYIKKSKSTKKQQNEKNDSKENPKILRLMNYVFLNPVGIYPSFWHEIYYFSNFYWKKLFKRYNFEIINIKNSPFSYSGYNVFKKQFLKSRKLFSKKFPSSTCYVLEKQDQKWD